MKSAAPTWLTVLLVMSLTLVPGLATAEPVAEADEESVRREAAVLFKQARALMEQQDFEAAVVRLVRSYALRPTVGTLLNLGRCEQLRGRLATARDYYLQAVRLADDINDAERRDFAR
jgi:Flp pilus assembly protein TadD